MSKPGSTTTVLTPAARGLHTYDAHRARLKARTTTHWFTWRHVRCKVEVTSDYLQDGWTHLQLHVIAARDTPVPITGSGYLSHGIDAQELSAAGGAVAFLTAWMDREARARRFQDILYRWRQGDLLDVLALDEEDREA